MLLACCWQTQLTAHTVLYLSQSLDILQHKDRPQHLHPFVLVWLSVYSSVVSSSLMRDGDRMMCVGSSTRSFPAEQRPASFSDTAAFFASVVWCGLADRLLGRASCERVCFRDICSWGGSRRAIRAACEPSPSEGLQWSVLCAADVWRCSQTRFDGDFLSLMWQASQSFDHPVSLPLWFED